MPTFAQALDLRNDPDLIAKYDEHHASVPTEVVRALRDIGITRMEIYRLGARLFMVYDAIDGFSPERDYQRYAANPACREWDNLMRGFQQRAPGAPDGAWWAPMTRVFEMRKA